jgi:hypothetical protein
MMFLSLIYVYHTILILIVTTVNFTSHILFFIQLLSTHILPFMYRAQHSPTNLLYEYYLYCIVFYHVFIFKVCMLYNFSCFKDSTFYNSYMNSSRGVFTV